MGFSFMSKQKLTRVLRNVSNLIENKGLDFSVRFTINSLIFIFVTYGVEKSMKYKKKILGLGPIFPDLVYPRDHKNAHMKIFH